MPSCPRRDVVIKEEIGVYHCRNRCVQRAFLCGKDSVTGQDYEYRRLVIKDVEEQLAGLFAIDICFHAEQSNHIHLELRNRPDVAAAYSDKEVARRSWYINRLKRLGHTDIPEPTEKDLERECRVPGRIDRLRQRLADVSWFMGTLCEHLARRFNRESGTGGAFWEHRFQCSKLQDEGAILACGVYIDLNPIRAGEALTPEEARHTSAYNRIQARQQQLAQQSATQQSEIQQSEIQQSVEGTPQAEPMVDEVDVSGLGGSAVGQDGVNRHAKDNARDNHSADKSHDAGDESVVLRDCPNRSPGSGPDEWLCPLTIQEQDPAQRAGVPSHLGSRASDKGLLPISLEKYLELLDWTGRQLREGCRGAIPASLAPILERLGICGERWLESVSRFESYFGHVIGKVGNVMAAAQRVGRHWFRGQSRCALVFR